MTRPPTIRGPPAFLPVGSFYGTLAAVRELGRAGIPAAVADASLFAPALWSRFAATRMRSPPLRLSEPYLDWLRRAGRQRPGMVLLPTTDELAWLVAANAAELGRIFRIAHASEEVQLTLLDKCALSEAAAAAGVPTLPSRFPAGEDELLSCSSELPFPLVVKPRTQLFHRNHCKGSVVDDRASLVRAWRAFAAVGCADPVLLRRRPGLQLPFVQAYAPEVRRGVLSVVGFMESAEDIFVTRQVRKRVLDPRQLAIGLSFESGPEEPGVADSVRALCESVGYSGIFEAEFVWFEKAWRLIDFNPRFYGQMQLDIARGLPLAELAYLRALGERDAMRTLALAAADTAGGPQAHIHGLPLRIELALMRLSGSLGKGETRRWSEWLSATRTSKTDAVFDRFDRLPSLADALQTVYGYARHPRTLLRRLLARSPQRA